MRRVDRSDLRLPVVINTPNSEGLRRPVESALYLSIQYTERLAQAGIELSVGSVGESYEFKLVHAGGLNDPEDHSKAQNALAQTIIGRYKAEVIHRRAPWCNFGTVEYATLEWVDCFNNHRLLGPIGSIPPAEAEASSYADPEPDNMAA